MSKLVIFSDLDGTLLDHHTYSFEAAKDTLQSLKAHKIPCVLNTSKTFAELLNLRAELSHTDPFIVENGAAIYIPKGSQLEINDELEDCGNYWRKAMGPSRTKITEITNTHRSDFEFVRFSDMSSLDIANLTGLSIEKAVQAMQREFTEPMVWNDSEAALSKFKDSLENYELQVQKGGRFTHVMGKHCDKAKAMNWLASQYTAEYSENITTMALGDGENDIGMLSAADIPVVIRSPVHIPPKVPNRTDAWLTSSYGPIGWAEAVKKALIQEGYL
ncbi:HAD-IIB family hydrolase [Marinomonas balearica]|uniref:Mannosyl-3-phosphoglycerate phosphatase n=1 Tax=Marinomonas balearica TaxID=491947 RepID=A0A4R6MG30_9GAMM|nr:HAD-IIB family hydrolase [Marinomonas balearica]TDO99089.1 mannosyl-3-phosphoglycerate phosphatase [Marinomonas balearica]